MVSSSLWQYPATLMSVGFILMTAGMLIAQYLKTRQGWLKIPKAVGIVGALFAIAGLLMAIYMVSVSKGAHFRVPHTYLSAITIIFAAMTPIRGYAQLKVTNSRVTISAIHRCSGRITLVLMLVTILSALSLVYVL